MTRNRHSLFEAMFKYCVTVIYLVCYSTERSDSDGEKQALSKVVHLFKTSCGKKPSLELWLPSTLHPKAGFFVVVSWFPAETRALVSFFVSGEEPFSGSSCVRR